MNYCEALYLLIINGSWKMPLLAVGGCIAGLLVFVVSSTFIHWKTGSDIELTIWKFKYKINKRIHHDQQDR